MSRERAVAGHPRRMGAPRSCLKEMCKLVRRQPSVRGACFWSTRRAQEPQRLHRWAAVEAAGFQPKKRSVGAMERDEWLRAAWRVMVAEEVDPARLLFVDEMGANVALYSLYAWSKRGERAQCSVPRNRGKNTTLCFRA